MFAGPSSGARLTANHHAFTQALMARGAVPESEARALYRQLLRQSDDAGFDSFWAAINRELAFLHLEMRRVNVPPTPDAALVLYVGIVNKLSDDISKLATRYTPPQIALFRAIIEASADITRAKHGIDGLAVLNLPLFALSAAGEATQSQEGGAGPSQAAPAGASVRMSVSDREATLRAMVAEGWLLGDSRSSVRLGPKAFLELGTQLVKASEDEEVQALWQTYV